MFSLVWPERKRKDYYASLERNSKDTEITGWLKYFAGTILEARTTRSSAWISTIPKRSSTRSIAALSTNVREKVIAQISREGIDGFQGGLSAENYISVTGTS